MNIEEHVDDIIQARESGGGARHMYLEGFHKLIDGVILNSSLTDRYLEKQKEEFTPFTRIRTGGIIPNYYKKQMDKAYAEMLDKAKGCKKVSEIEEVIKKAYAKIDFDITGEYLPINDDYHLHFFLYEEDDSCKIFYDTCDICEGYTHALPRIFLKSSMNITVPKDASLMVDNTESVDLQTRVLLVQSYKAMQEFIDEVKD